MKSENGAARRRPVRQHLAVALIALGLLSQPVSPSVQVPAGVPTPSAGTGIISGGVVDERQEPVPRAQVLAFSVRTTVSQAQQGRTVPFSMRASGSASTDAEGRFEISGLDLGDYLVAAETVPSLTSGASSHTSLYATTFHPSTVDHRVAVHVSATSYDAAPIRIEMVRMQGVRVAGTVASRSGRSLAGMNVRMFHQFGGFGSESTVAAVNADGSFEIPRVPPGWYRLTIAPRQTASSG